MNAKSDNIKKDNTFDFDIIDKDDLNLNEIIEKKNNKQIKNEKLNTKNKSSKNLNIINYNSKNVSDGEKIEDINKNITSEPNMSRRLDEFEIIEENSLLFQKNYKEKNDNLIEVFINKIISEKELLTPEISNLINLLNMEDPSSNKLYSYTFLTKLKELNNKYIIIMKNKKNFVHLSNILNDISIKQNKINILKLIIDISQNITYRELYLFNLLQKKNNYFSTKTFWSKIILDSYINDLNNFTNLLLKENNNNENYKTKEKESNVYLLEFIHFSNNIINYKKLYKEEKIRLDKFARNNIKNILTKSIEGMSSFLVQKSIAMEVITDFGKNFGFNSEDINFYELSVDIYNDRNYIHNLKKISLDDEKNSKIFIISNAAQFLRKKHLINLLILEKN